MAWIELHLDYDGSPVGINPNNITAFATDVRYGKTYIDCCGDEDKCYYVKESREEVKELIMNALGVDFYRKEVGNGKNI